MREFEATDINILKIIEKLWYYIYILIIIGELESYWKQPPRLSLSTVLPKWIFKDGKSLLLQGSVRMKTRNSAQHWPKTEGQYWDENSSREREQADVDKVELRN